MARIAGSVLSSNGAPRQLREVLNQAFLYRTSVRWRAGTSALLGLDYAEPPPGAIIDVSGVPEFHTVRRERGRLSIGAFIDAPTLRSDPAVTDALGAASGSAEAARFRLAALGAELVVAGPGATRTTPLRFEVEPLPMHEIPVAIRLRESARDVWFGNRRLTRKDGRTSFDLQVHVALEMSGAHRIAGASACATVDGRTFPLPAVQGHLAGAVIARTTFAVAARNGADAFRGDDERTNVMRRTIVPLLLSALSDAYSAARARAS